MTTAGARLDRPWNESWTEGLSFSGSTEHRWQEGQDVGATGIADLDNVGDEVAFEVYPNGNAAGKVKYSGKAIIESVSVPSEVNGKIMQSLSFKGNGALTKSLVA